MKEKLITFAVPCYNSQDYMQRCLRSLMAGGEEVEIIQESSIDSIIRPGTHIKLQLNTEKVNVFTADGSANILTGVCNDCAAS